MPISRQDKRFEVYDRLFRNPNKRYTRKEIEDELALVEKDLDDITPQTFNTDINTIRKKLEKIYSGKKGEELLVSEYTKGHQKVYYYSDSSISLYLNAVTYSAVCMLAGVQGINVSFLDDLCAKMNVPKIRERYVSTATTADGKGIEHFEQFYNAIKDKRPLDISFKPFYDEDGKEGKGWQSVVHPYHLRQYTGRWNLFGWVESKGCIKTIPLDRVEAAGYAKDVEFKKLEDVMPGVVFDVMSENDYLADVIGVTRIEDNKPELIKLKFDKNRFNYVCTHPLHRSQESYTLDKIITIKVRRNQELETLILSFGKDVKVLEPENLLKRIKKIQRDLAFNYGIITEDQYRCSGNRKNDEETDEEE